MAALLAVLGTAVYLTVAAALLDELDTGLRTRAAALRADLTAAGVDLGTTDNAGTAEFDAGGGLVEPAEAVAQVLDRDGTILATSPGFDAPVLAPAQVAAVTQPHLFEADVAGITGRTRIVAVPAQRGSTQVVAVVGASMSDRDDALTVVAICLAVGGPVALGIASLTGWIVAGAALRPVERLRRQAAAISASGLDRRLDVPVVDDEFRRLAVTLNAMLGRLEHAQRGERRFLDHASHELRTPLTILRTELDIALACPRPATELLAALRSAHEESARLCRLAEDLLLLSRAHDGRLPILRTLAPLAAPMHDSARRFAIAAAARDVRIEVHATADPVSIDHTRVRQAVDNLLDNALRYAPDGSTITVSGDRHTTTHGDTVHIDTVHITVHDTGPGFPPELAEHAFDPFHGGTTGPSHPTSASTGLGLTIVRAVAEGHGGTVSIDPDTPTGTRIRMVLPVAATPSTAARPPR